MSLPLKLESFRVRFTASLIACAITGAILFVLGYVAGCFSTLMRS